MKIYSTNEIRKIMGATQEVAAYVHEEAAHPVHSNQQEVLSLIAELEFDSKFEELLRSIRSRLPRL
jgi:hypothetical protein